MLFFAGCWCCSFAASRSVAERFLSRLSTVCPEILNFITIRMIKAFEILPSSFDSSLKRKYSASFSLSFSPHENHDTFISSIKSYSPPSASSHHSQTFFPVPLLSTLSSKLFLRSTTEPYPPFLTRQLCKTILFSVPLSSSFSSPFFFTALFVLLSNLYLYQGFVRFSIYTLSHIPHTARSHSLLHFPALPYAYTSSFCSHF